MTFMYEPTLRQAPIAACAGRCLRCTRQCTTDPADIEPPNRKQTIILPDPAMTPIPEHR